MILIIVFVLKKKFASKHFEFNPAIKYWTASFSLVRKATCRNDDSIHNKFNIIHAHFDMPCNVTDADKATMTKQKNEL